MLHFSNDGGPLMISPRAPRPLWEGVQAPSGGRVVETASSTVLDVATDYDRACDAADGAQLLDAGDGWVVVLPAEAEAMWLPEPPRGVGAVVFGIETWFDETTPERMQALYASVATAEWKLLGDDVPLGEGGLALMYAGGVRGEDIEYAHDATRESRTGKPDSAFIGIGDAIVYPLGPGRYRVESYEHLVPDTSETPAQYLILVRFIAVSDSRATPRP